MSTFTNGLPTFSADVLSPVLFSSVVSEVDASFITFVVVHFQLMLFVFIIILFICFSYKFIKCVFIKKLSKSN